MTKPETNKQLLSTVIDCLTKVIEDQHEFSEVRDRCRGAKMIVEDAVFECEFVDDEEAA